MNIKDYPAITSDSRTVTPGCLFIAVKGTKADGNEYAEAALKAGAAATVSTDRHGLAMMADEYYGHPSGKLKLVGITGTNGKTTTVTLLYNMFRSLGYECGLLSTIANYVGTRLDYHGTFAEYLRCKKLFFDNLPASAVAVTNVDDRHGLVMTQNTAARVVTYSCRSVADHSCRVIEESFGGMLLRIDGTEVWTRLIGAHNAYNLLAVYCAAIELGTPKEEALVALSTLGAAPGRLENIRGPRDLSVVIDYAHTPDAMDNVLGTLRDVAPERELICLFGCGGDRDRTKRPEMAAVAEKWADRIFVTSDNSRTEKTEDILEDIRKGFSPKGLAKAIFIADRKEAIRTAIMLAPRGATILLAGKGHETYQIIGTEKRHFDEREIVNDVFKTID